MTLGNLVIAILVKSRTWFRLLSGIRNLRIEANWKTHLWWYSILGSAEKYLIQPTLMYHL